SARSCPCSGRRASHCSCGSTARSIGGTSTATDSCPPARSRAPASRSDSVRARVAEYAHERQRDDLEVEAQRPVLDVVEVVLDAAIERRVPAESVDLRPAGHAGLHVMTQHVARDLRAELIDVLRTFGPWADETHVADEHVPQLRQLVEREPAQDV